MPTAISAAAAIAAWRAGLGFGGRPESASTTGRRATVRARPPGGGGRPEDGEEDGRRDQPPGKAEPVDAMVDGGLERRGERRARARGRRSSRRPRRSRRRWRRWSAARVGGASAWRRRRRACRAGGAVAARRPRSPRRRPARPGAGRRWPRRTSPACLPPAVVRRASEPAKAEPERSPGIRTKESIDSSLASTRTVTWSGAPADEGETSANSSLSLRGFSTMPTTVRRRPSSARVDPSSSRRSSATPSVTATSPGPSGSCRRRSASSSPPYAPRGSCARKSTVSTPPGTATERWPIDLDRPERLPRRRRARPRACADRSRRT